jgi:hypothetical protein
MALNSGFRFRTIALLGVQPSDASDLTTVGYLLELLCDGSPAGATMKIGWPSPVESPQVLIPILG